MLISLALTVASGLLASVESHFPLTADGGSQKMKYKKILLATDFFSCSQAALQHASVLARESGATLLIVHVAEPPLVLGVDIYFPNPGYPDPEVRRRLKAVIPSDPSVRYEHRLLLGAAVDQILQLADQEQVDLIVMGTHGRTGLSRILMGSVAEGVLQKATCPVLTFKLPQSTAAATKSPSCVSVGE